MSGVTLLITTHNRGELLQRSLTRIAQRALPDEILVIDDGGDDETARICWEFIDLLPIEYVYHHNPGHTICSQARNVGVKLASNDLIVTSEPEVMFETNVIEQMRQLHGENPTQVISQGVCYAAPSEGVVDPLQCEKRIGWVAPYSALYHRDWLVAVGGWDESFPDSWGWDDTDLLSRLRFAGYNQLIAREIEVLHQWHPPVGGGQQNEQHFLRKSYHRQPPDLTDVVANKGSEWGQLTQRP